MRALLSDRGAARPQRDAAAARPDLQFKCGGNGWLGVGWDLAVPAITIDTRWGVPRYDAQKETRDRTC